jgi:nitroreductase
MRVENQRPTYKIIPVAETSKISSLLVLNNQIQKSEFMEFNEVLNGRESIRSYDPGKPVDRQVLGRILEAGRLAPSAANFQPWKFFLITSGEMLEKVRSCYSRSWFCDAPHILVVSGNEKAAWVRSDGYNSIETDLTIAMDHMILAAENEGVATVWIANFNYDLLRKALKLSGHEVIFAITPLGYPRTGFTKKGIKNRKPISEVAEYL